MKYYCSQMYSKCRWIFHTFGAAFRVDWVYCKQMAVCSRANQWSFPTFFWVATVPWPMTDPWDDCIFYSTYMKTVKITQSCRQTCRSSHGWLSDEVTLYEPGLVTTICVSNGVRWRASGGGRWGGSASILWFRKAGKRWRLRIYLSNEKKTSCLGYIGYRGLYYPVTVSGDYNKPL